MIDALAVVKVCDTIEASWGGPGNPSEVWTVVHISRSKTADVAVARRHVGTPADGELGFFLSDGRCTTEVGVTARPTRRWRRYD